MLYEVITDTGAEDTRARHEQQDRGDKFRRADEPPPERLEQPDTRPIAQGGEDEDALLRTRELVEERLHEHRNNFV